MDKKRDISDVFKDKLQDYESPVKRDLWASLESHVPAEKTLWRRIYPVVASAAAVLAILIMFHKLIFDESTISDTPVELTVVKTEQNDNMEIKDGREGGEESSVVMDEVVAPEIPVNTASFFKNPKPREEIAATETPINIDSDFVNPESNDEVVVVAFGRRKSEALVVEEKIISAEDNEKLAKQQQSSDSVTVVAFGRQPLERVVASVSQSHGNVVAFGSQSRESVVSSDNQSSFSEKKTDIPSSGLQLSISGQVFFGMSNESDFLKTKNMHHLNSNKNKFDIGGEYALKSIKYHTPVNLNINIIKKISPRWAIEAGISYTKLSSEEKWMTEKGGLNNRDMLYKDIKLYYLGLPLRASYYLIKKDPFFVYLSGGGMIEKSISGKVYTVLERGGIEKNTNIKIRELQYSVTGGAGIEVKLLSPVNIFVEPGVSYYFDDGSDMMTVRKDKPFNFNIKGGLRFNF